MSKKIMIFSYEFPPFNGGVGVVAEKILQYTKKEAYVLTLKSACNTQYDNNQKIVRILPKNKYGLVGYLLGVYYLIVYLRKENIKSVVAVCSRSQRVCFLASFIRKFQYVNILHGSEILGIFNSRKGRIFSRLYKRSIGNFPVSEYVNEIAKSFEIQNLQVIKLGSTVTMPLTPVLNKSNIISTISRLDRRKGHYEILKSLNLVFKMGGDFTYYVAGTGDELDRLVAYADTLLCKDHIVFLGEIDAQEKNKLLQKTKIYVMHSLQVGNTVEGFGISFLEAGHYADLVIGTDHGGAVEALSLLPNSEYVAEYDIKKLAEIIHSALSKTINISNIQTIREDFGEKMKKNWIVSCASIEERFNS